MNSLQVNEIPPIDEFENIASFVKQNMAFDKADLVGELKIFSMKSMISGAWMENILSTCMLPKPWLIGITDKQSIIMFIYADHLGQPKRTLGSCSNQSINSYVFVSLFVCFA